MARVNWFVLVVLEFLMFLEMSFFVEVVSSKSIGVGVSLIITFTIQTFKAVRIQFALFSF